MKTAISPSRRVLLLIGIAILTAPGRTRALESSALFMRPGTTTVSGMSSKGSVITASCRVGLTSRSLREFKGFWGVESGGPAISITSLTITVAKDTLDIPFTAWADLGYPESMWLSFGTGADTLSVRGGSTSTGYTARMIIEDRRLVKRRVELGEFPDEVWQETSYSSGLTDDGGR